MADVFVGYLHPGEVDTHFHHSLLSLVLWDKTNSNRIAGYFADQAATNEVALGRNKIVESFLSMDAEWLFMVDADMGFTPDTVDRLLAVADPQERPIVGALAFSQFALPAKSPLGDIRYRLVVTIMRLVQGSDGTPPRVLPVDDYPRDRLVECDATGAACLLIHRSVLEKMAETFPPPMRWFDTMNLNGAHFSEDITFCTRAKALGFPIHVDPRVKTSHRKTHFLTEEAFDAARVAPAATEATAVIVPVLHRPQNAEPFMRSLRASTGVARVYAVANPEDAETTEAWEACGAEVIDTSGKTFARKVNVGYDETDEPWLFIVGDDVKFRPGWLDHAQHVANVHNASVVGTNDLGNPRVMAGDHATHLLISRAYIDEQGASWDGPKVVCHEGYRHWYVDDEIVTVAKQRGIWAMALGSLVEHLHPAWGKAEMDETYELGQRHSKDDQKLFRGRCKAFLRDAR